MQTSGRPEGPAGTPGSSAGGGLPTPARGPGPAISTEQGDPETGLRLPPTLSGSAPDRRGGVTAAGGTARKDQRHAAAASGRARAAAAAGGRGHGRKSGDALPAMEPALWFRGPWWNVCAKALCACQFGCGAVSKAVGLVMSKSLFGSEFVVLQT